MSATTSPSEQSDESAVLSHSPLEEPSMEIDSATTESSIGRRTTVQPRPDLKHKPLAQHEERTAAPEGRRKRTKTAKAASEELDDSELEDLLQVLEATTTPRGAARQRKRASDEGAPEASNGNSATTESSVRQVSHGPPSVSPQPAISFPAPGSVNTSQSPSPTKFDATAVGGAVPNARHETYFWHEPTCRIYPIGHELQTDKDSEILEFPPGSYTGPYPPSSMPESGFVRQQPCVASCKFTVSHGKRPATIKDHFIRCGEREMEFKRTRKFDVIARLYTLQVDAQRRNRAMKRSDTVLDDLPPGIVLAKAPKSSTKFVRGISVDRHVANLPRRVNPSGSQNGRESSEPWDPDAPLYSHRPSASANMIKSSSAEGGAGGVKYHRPRKSKLAFPIPVTAVSDDDFESGRDFDSDGNGNGKRTKLAVNSKTRPVVGGRKNKLEEALSLAGRDRMAVEGPPKNVAPHAQDSQFLIKIHGDPSLLPQVSYILHAKSFPISLRPRSISHESPLAGPTVSTYEFVIPGQAIARKGMLSINLESEVLGVPNESDILLSRGGVGLTVRAGELSWKFRKAEIVGGDGTPLEAS